MATDKLVIEMSLDVLNELKSKKEVLVYGGGEFAERVVSDLTYNEIKVLYIFDRDASKCGKFIKGVEILHADRLSEFSNVGFIVFGISPNSTDLEPIASWINETFGINEFYCLNRNRIAELFLKYVGQYGFFQEQPRSCIDINILRENINKRYV